MECRLMYKMLQSNVESVTKHNPKMLYTHELWGHLTINNFPLMKSNNQDVMRFFAQHRDPMTLIRNIPNILFSSSTDRLELDGRFKDYLSINSTCLICTPLGSKKTERMIEFIGTLEQSVSICVVSCRKELVYELGRKLSEHNFKVYKKIVPIREHRVVMQVDSLHRIDRDYDIVVFDESNQTLSRVTKHEDNIESLRELLVNAKKVIFMDAIAETLSSDVLLSTRHKIDLCVGYSVKSMLGKTFHIHKSRNSLEEEFRTSCLDRNYKTVLCSDLRTECISFSKIAKHIIDKSYIKTYPYKGITLELEMPVVLMTGSRDINGMETKKSTIRKIGYSKVADDCDVFIYSPCITSGVSIITQCPARVFQVINFGFSTYAENIQMLTRFRNCSEYHIFVEGPPRIRSMDDKPLTDDLETIIKYYNSNALKATMSGYKDILIDYLEEEGATIISASNNNEDTSHSDILAYEGILSKAQDEFDAVKDIIEPRCLSNEEIIDYLPTIHPRYWRILDFVGPIGCDIQNNESLMRLALSVMKGFRLAESKSKLKDHLRDVLINNPGRYWWNLGYQFKVLTTWLKFRGMTDDDAMMFDRCLAILKCIGVEGNKVEPHIGRKFKPDRKLMSEKALECGPSSIRIERIDDFNRYISMLGVKIEKVSPRSDYYILAKLV